MFAARGLRVANSTAIGRGKEHLSLILEDPQGRQHRALWWNGAAWPQPEGPLDLAYSLRASNFRGQREASIEWIDSRPLPAEESVPGLPRWEIIDHRGARHPRPLLDALLAQGGAMVWAEGAEKERVNGLDRCALAPAETLIVWTAPPGRGELLAALRAVQPRRIVLFAHPPGDETFNAFVLRLAGLANHVINRLSGAALLRQLAAACAQREAAARLGLDWLQAEGRIQVSYTPEGGVLLAKGSGNPVGNSAAVAEKLKILLTETTAYRRVAATAPAESLIG